jgi:hypothetical protein
VQLTICQHILTRHDELRERARQLLEQARREAAARGNNPQLTAQSPVKVRAVRYSGLEVSVVAIVVYLCYCL